MTEPSFALPEASTLILASASPRRAELLQQLGLQFQVQPTEINERPHDRETAEDYAVRMAREKALAGQQRLKNNNSDGLILAADTVVVAPNGDIFGKPVDQAMAVSYLRRLSGQQHRVMTSVAIADSSRVESILHTSSVWFRQLSDIEISQYVATGEPMDKAGAYAIQGKAAAFIQHIEGSYSGIMGLPLAQIVELLQQFAPTIVSR